MLAWMAVVFVMSTDLGSSAHTGRFLGPLLRWLYPPISPAAIEQVHFALRKAGHVTEYAILAILTLRALRLLRPAPSGWSWQAAGLAFLISTTYAVTDEAHQMLVASRGPSPQDVLIDACGAALGLAMAFGWVRGGRRPVAVPA